MRTNFIMMIGLPASGKSYKAKELSQLYNANIHSSDKLRLELFGDENIQGGNDTLFSELHKRIKDDLNVNKSVIYDATNISYKRRMNFLSEIKKYNCNKIVVIIATPYDECLKRNQNRNRVVPEHVIRKMYMNWNTPYWYEGWDDIRIEYGEFKDKGYPVRIIDKYVDYNQNSMYHNLSLGKHLEKTWIYVCKNGGDLPLRIAALLHDCGKPFTKSFLNSKGETTENAHYYQHHCVGAYDSLFYNTIDNPLDHAILIQWHMQPYFWEKDELKGEKQMSKYKKLWGDKLFNDIMLLHKADKMAH